MQIKLSTKEKAFIDGIHYAIIQVNSGMTLNDLYFQTTDEFNFAKMTEALKNVDFKKIFEIEDLPLLENMR